MIISPGRNFIFVHIPKTGGTSLSLALEARAMKEDILIGDTPKAIKRRGRLKGVQSAGRLWKHSTLADIDGLVSREFVADAFCFTLVRNPWDRMVSYYHWLREQAFDHPAVRLAKETEFSPFLNAPQTRVSIKSWPFSRYMCGADGAERCNKYIRLEQFDEDAAELWAHLGFELEMPQINRSARKIGYRDYYSKVDRTLIEQLCGEDIRRFDYRF